MDNRLQERRASQLARTGGFTQSSTTHKLEGVNINRKDARTHRSLARKTTWFKHDKQDRFADSKADGYLSIRTFHKLAGILVIPYSESEMKSILIAAREEYEAQGLLSVDTEINLTNAGYDVLKMTQLWDMFDAAEIGTTEDTDPSLNTFGEEA